MNKLNSIFVLIISLLILSACGDEDNSPNSNSEISNKETAEEFSLQIIEYYFNEDCDAYYNSLSEVLYSLEEDMEFEKESFEKEEICEDLSNAINGDHTYQDYLDSYNVRLLDKEEFENEFPEIANMESYSSRTNDYLFIGSKVKDGKENFIWDDMFIFIVRKTDEGWKIIAA